MFAAGDPGGANAILPVLTHLADCGHPVGILDHGPLGRAAADLPRVKFPQDCADASLWLRDNGIRALCFGTSLADPLPLTLARVAGRLGLRTVCVLDNWMNYRMRLMMDGLAPFWPDVYAVMDDKAREEALADGVPAACLTVTGHPGLACLAQIPQQATRSARLSQRRALGLPGPDRKLVVFINEPVQADQGDPARPDYRGYTEATVLPALCRQLERLNQPLFLALAPHPRDDLAGLEALWQQSRGHLEGQILSGLTGRQAVALADKVVGMASILLYEAWLLGRPTLSLQPGLRRPDLASLKARQGLFFVESECDMAAAIQDWWQTLNRTSSRRLDLNRHAGAAGRIADLLI